MDETQRRLLLLEAQMMGVVTQLPSIVASLGVIVARLLADADDPVIADALKEVETELDAVHANLRRIVESLPPPASGKSPVMSP